MKKNKKKLIHLGKKNLSEKLNNKEVLEIKGLEREKEFTDKVRSSDDLYTDKVIDKKSKLNKKQVENSDIRSGKRKVSSPKKALDDSKINDVDSVKNEYNSSNIDIRDVSKSDDSYTSNRNNEVEDDSSVDNELESYNEEQKKSNQTFKNKSKRISKEKYSLKNDFDEKYNPSDSNFSNSSKHSNKKTNFSYDEKYGKKNSDKSAKSNKDVINKASAKSRKLKHKYDNFDMANYKNSLY